MMDIDTMQIFLIPFLYFIYGVILVLKRPEMGSNMGFAIKRAKQSEEAWRYTQNVAAVYCFVSVAILLAGIYVIGLVGLGQILLELVLVICMYPVVNGLVKKKFPD